MKKILISKSYYFFILLLPIIICSCREDIIPPNSPVTNINEPVTSNSKNYYSFFVNAKNASYTVVDHTYLDYGSTNLFYTVTNHSGGYISLILTDNYNNVQYQEIISSNSSGTSKNIKEANPDIVEIIFYNFTGQLQIQITSTM